MSQPSTSPESLDRVHFIASGLTVPINDRGFGRVAKFGDEMVVTPAIIEATRDRFGASWLLDLVDDEAGQVRRWGKPMFRRGPWPADQSRYEVGSWEWEDAREAARQAAHSIPDAAQRARALREVEVKFGKAGPTSKTLARYEPSGVRA